MLAPDGHITEKGPGRSRRALRVLFASALAAGSWAALPGTAYASGLETSGVGARGRSLGYALTAAADDWTAAYYNPAALAWARGGTAAALYEYFTGGLSSSDSLRNLPPAAGPDPARGDFVDPVGDEPSSFTRRDVGAVAHAAEAGWVSRAGAVGLAAGFYGSGAGSEWEDRVPTEGGDSVSAGFSYRNLSLNVPLAVGAELLPGLSAGLAVTLRYGLLEARVEKQRTGATFEYLQRFEQETAGGAASFDAGLLWKIGERASVGAVWRFPYAIVKRGDTSVDQSLSGLSLERETRVEESIPARAALGAAWRPRAGDLLAVSAVWMDWSAYRRTTTYDEPVPGVLEDGGGNPAEWQDTWVLSAGWEHALGRGWSSRLGLVHDQAPEPRSQRTLVGGQVVDAWKVAVGFGWAGRRAAVDVGYTHSWNSGVEGYLPDTEYQLSLHEAYVGFSWRF